MAGGLLMHPTHEQLTAFDAGRLGESDSNAIEEHLTDCSLCCQFLKQLPSDDGYVALLRAAFASHDATVMISPTLEVAGAETNGPHNRGRVDHLSTNASSSNCLRRFSNYELLSEIARGGMGVVYKARQIGLNRVVALKMILAGQLASPDAVQRFYAEANAAAHLDHPGIVPIYEVGEQDGQHFFTMALVNGSNLAERLRQGPMPPREVASLLRNIAVAVQHAHDKGVIHRDLKPANVLLEGFGVGDWGLGKTDGNSLPLPTSNSQLLTPRITDFGLAKLTTSDSHLTGTGQIVGTPSFMPPEQAAGRAHEIRETADVYSLGAILYACLTGRPPHQAATALETVMQVLDAEPAPPRLLNPQVPRDLEAICLKCLQKEPTRRYATAQLVADELQRFLDGEPIQAASVNLLDHMLRALRKDRHEETFRNWGRGLMTFGLVIALGHAAIFLLETAGYPPVIAFWLPRALMLALLVLLLWHFRRRSILPTNSVERLVWCVWIGYLICVGMIGVTLSASSLDPSLRYAFSAILAGLGFFIMGVHVWGGAYVIGWAFLLAAPLLSMSLHAASLAYGGLWGISLLWFGGHYCRLARTTNLASPTQSHGSSDVSPPCDR